MALSGNKGDWSEIYVLLKLLGDKEVAAGNMNMKKAEGLLYPIISIFRSESFGKNDYSYDSDFVVINSSGLEKLRIKIDDFKKQAANLLNAIKIAEGSSFTIPETELFMKSINTKEIKARSTDKSDITLIIYDKITETNQTLGFSIKSQLGGPSTLLNAGRTTNFFYKINDIDLSNKDRDRINQINSTSKVKNRVLDILKNCGSLSFSDMESKVFKNNLILIDSRLPEIIAEIILKFFSTDHSKVSDLIELVQKENPLGYDLQHSHKYYEYKIKRFLTDNALGMMPATVWSGQYDATGGYLVVKEDGDILCYHIYNKNDFEEYLYKNTKLETASTSRHRFGIVEKKGNSNYFILNLQIRFIS